MADQSSLRVLTGDLTCVVYSASGPLISVKKRIVPLDLPYLVFARQAEGDGMRLWDPVKLDWMEINVAGDQATQKRL